MSAETDIIKTLENRAPWPVDIVTAELVVTIESGVVALTGCVRCCMRESQRGREELPTAAVADDVLEIHVPLAFKRSDIEVARNTAGALRSALPCSCEYVRLTVQDGRLTLDGELEWSYQHQRIEAAIRTVAGVIGLSDRSRLSSQADPTQIRGRIRETLGASAEAGANRLRAVDDETLERNLLSWAVPG
jgi:osmotically-inducible protein OsmY